MDPTMLAYLAAVAALLGLTAYVVRSRRLRNGK